MAATNLEINVYTQIIPREETCALLMASNKENVINNHRYLRQMFTYRLHTKTKMLCSLAATHYTSYVANIKIFKLTRSKKYYYEKGLDFTTCAVKITEPP